DYSYAETCTLVDGTKKATLNIHTGEDGGFAEAKYYSEVRVTLLADDISATDDAFFIRVCEVLNAFLDKYRLINEDYRVQRISDGRNYYVVGFHTSPLRSEEIGLSTLDLFKRLESPREFKQKLGHGAFNSLRTNTYELIGPPTAWASANVVIFAEFAQQKYEMPLFYELVLESLACLQKSREYRLSIVHAETALEVYVAERLSNLMVACQLSAAKTASMLENNRDYRGIKSRLRRLDEWTERWAAKNGGPFSAFFNSALYLRWDTDLYKKRNEAVHAGASAFSYEDASTALGICKECISALEDRVPDLADRVKIKPSMSGFRKNAGEVQF
ncbi:MAG: hypothetical protein ACREDR_32815, partial [Blastocatellia bacterium]